MERTIIRRLKTFALVFALVGLCKSASAACPGGWTSLGGGQCQRGFTTGTTTVTLPTDWSSTNIVELLGAGDAGTSPNTTKSGGGGGSGAYAKGVNLTGLSGTINIQVDSGSDEDATWFNSTSYLQATSAFGTTGGAASGSALTLGVGGGTGALAGANGKGGSSGAGASGPLGIGASGVQSGGTDLGGSGGSGGNNGIAGTSATTSNGGAGGLGGGSCGGTAGTGGTAAVGGNGTGDGGGGGGATLFNGGNGGFGCLWPALSAGPGGGGGGAGTGTTTGGAGGFGAGSGGGGFGATPGTNGMAGSGLIVITYTQFVPTSVKRAHGFGG